MPTAHATHTSHITALIASRLDVLRSMRARHNSITTAQAHLLIIQAVDAISDSAPPQPSPDPDNSESALAILLEQELGLWARLDELFKERDGEQRQLIAARALGMAASTIALIENHLNNIPKDILHVLREIEQLLENERTANRHYALAA